MTDFAALVPRLAYALTPWTPLVPFVFVRPRRAARWRIALALAAMLAVAVDVRVAPFAIAGALVGSLSDLDNAPRPRMALLVAALGFLVVRDLDAGTGRPLRLATIVVTAFAATALVLRPRWTTAVFAAGAIAGLFLHLRGGT